MDLVEKTAHRSHPRLGLFNMTETSELSLLERQQEICYLFMEEGGCIEIAGGLKVKTDDLYLVYSIGIKLFYLITWPPELKATFFNLPTIKYMVFQVMTKF